MRDYKFRGKCLDNGEWVYGWLVIQPDGTAYISQYFKRGEWVQVISETVGQFIGIFDKNKKEIYEGQTIRDTISDMWYKVVFDGGRYTGRIVMHGPICGGMNIDDISKLHMTFYEIIEPELLEVKA